MMIKILVKVEDVNTKPKNIYPIKHKTHSQLCEVSKDSKQVPQKKKKRLKTV